jgi:hypothetical protein
MTLKRGLIHTEAIDEIERLRKQNDKLADLLVRATSWVDEHDEAGAELLRRIRLVLTPAGHPKK